MRCEAITARQRGRVKVLCNSAEYPMPKHQLESCAFKYVYDSSHAEHTSICIPITNIYDFYVCFHCAQAPVARLPWTGSTYDALDFGQRCPVLTNLDPQLSDYQLEDCLNLCVYTKNVSMQSSVSKLIMICII